MTITLKNNILHLEEQTDMKHFLNAGYTIYDEHGRELRFTDKWEVKLKLINDWVVKNNVNQGATLSLKDTQKLIKDNKWNPLYVQGTIVTFGEENRGNWFSADKKRIYHLVSNNMYIYSLSDFVI